MSYTNATGVYLHQFCQGVHQTTTYADSSTNGNILVGELLTGYLAGAVDAGTVFADAIDLCAFWQFQMIDEILCLTACRSVSYGDSLNLVFLYQLAHCEHGLHPLVTRRVGEDNIMMQEVALIIQTHNLTACTEAWVNAHHTLLTKGACHQQLLQIAHKDADGFLVGFLAR